MEMMPSSGKINGLVVVVNLKHIDFDPNCINSNEVIKDFWQRRNWNLPNFNLPSQLRWCRLLVVSLYILVMLKTKLYGQVHLMARRFLCQICLSEFLCGSGYIFLILDGKGFGLCLCLSS